MSPSYVWIRLASGGIDQRHGCQSWKGLSIIRAKSTMVTEWPRPINSSVADLGTGTGPLAQSGVHYCTGPLVLSFIKEELQYLSGRIPVMTK